MTNRNNMRKHYKAAGGVSTITGILNGSTGAHRAANHDANFRRILPTTMKKLMDEGLFVPDGNGSYKITMKGRRLLKGTGT